MWLLYKYSYIRLRKNNFRIREFGNFEDILTIFQKSFKIEVYFKTFWNMVQKSIFRSWTDQKSRIEFEKIDFLNTDLIHHRLIGKKSGPRIYSQNSRKHSRGICFSDLSETFSPMTQEILASQHFARGGLHRRIIM